jgi:hypothetical protein
VVSEIWPKFASDHRTLKVWHLAVGTNMGKKLVAKEDATWCQVLG